MRRIKGILMVLLSLALLAPAASVRAAEGEYTYTVRFFAGQQGSFESGEVVTYSGLKYGERVTFNQRMVSLEDDSKYYIKGIRESGKDNDTVGATSFPVTGDQDYVVAYGLRGNVVAYTIHYVDAEGRELAESETYYGNVGDKPVIAYLYVEGYQPQAYNITRTLSENVADNEFTFVYTPVSGTASEGAGQPGEEAEGAAGGDGTALDGEAGGDGTADDDGIQIEDEEVPQGQPAELIDEDEVPLAGGGESRTPIRGVMDITTRLLDLPVGAKAGIVLGFAVVVGVGVWLLLFHKKRKKQ